MSYGQAPFMRFYESKNGQDTRFLITSPASGCMLYYDATLGKFVNSNSLLFDPTTFTFTVHQVSTDLVVSTDIQTDTILVKDTGGMFYTIDMEITNLAGRLNFQPTNISIFPYDAGMVSIDGLGGITTSGASSGITIADRSTSDFFQIYCDAGVYTIKSNGVFGQDNFELSTAGIASLKGTSADMRFYQQSATPTNYYSLFTSAGNVFNLTYNGTSIATIGTTGITTLVPQKIQNTLSSSALAHFLTFVPLSATTTAGQVISTNASLNYVPSTGTLSATTFVGALTGSASRIGNTLNTGATQQFLTFVPLSASTASQVVGTSAGLSYVPSTGALTATTFFGNLSGTTGSVSGTFTATTFNGALSGPASLIATTQQTAGTFPVALLTIATTYPAGQVVNVSSALTYNAGTNTLTAPNLSRLTNPLYIGNVDGYTGGGNVPLAMLLNSLGNGFYNNIQLGHSSAINKSWFMGARNNTTASDTIFSLAPYGTSQTGCWYVGSGGATTQAGTLNAPDVNTTYLTINQGNIIIYDQFDGTKYWTISSSGGGQLYFNNTTSPLAIPFSMNYDGGGVSVLNAHAQAYDRSATSMELDSPCLTEGNFNEGVVYVGLQVGDLTGYGGKTSPTSTSSGALITMLVQACNPANRNVEVSFPLNFFNNFTRTSGTFAIDVNMTVLTVSMTRNGSNFTNFSYVRPTLPLTYRYTMTAGTTFTSIQQPACQLDIFFHPFDDTVGSIPTDDTYIIKIVPTFTTTTITGVGTRTGLNGGAGFDIDIGTVHSTAPTNFTFNTADPTGITALSITKSGADNKSVVKGYYLTSQYHNLVYQRTFTSEVGVVEPLCFTGGYTHYDITWMFSSSPTAFTALSFALATNTGTVLLTGYTGRTAILGDTYSQVAWTTTAFVAYMYNRNWMTYKMTISHPNTARAKVMTGTNNGSANGTTFLDCPHIMSGQNTTTTAYNSMYWSVVGTAVSGNITITGRNT